MLKNAFYFILKALFVLKIFKFLSISYKRPTDGTTSTMGGQTYYEWTDECYEWMSTTKEKTL